MNFWQAACQGGEGLVLEKRGALGAVYVGVDGGQGHSVGGHGGLVKGKSNEGTRWT